VAGGGEPQLSVLLMGYDPGGRRRTRGGKGSGNIASGGETGERWGCGVSGVCEGLKPACEHLGVAEGGVE